MQDIEKFYPLKGYEGLYEITKTGVVKSLGRFVSNNISPKPEKIMKLQETNNGYYKACLTDWDGNFKMVLVHRLVALTFIENTLNLPIINHLDGNKKNNNVSNLEWTTISGNAKHIYDVMFKTNHRRKLSDEEVLDIFINAIPASGNRKHGNEGNIDFYMSKYNIGRSTINKILSRRFYKNVTKNFKRKE